jgi:hypothetical protein
MPTAASRRAQAVNACSTPTTAGTPACPKSKSHTRPNTSALLCLPLPLPWHMAYGILLVLPDSGAHDPRSSAVALLRRAPGGRVPPGADSLHICITQARHCIVLHLSPGFRLPAYRGPKPTFEKCPRAPRATCAKQMTHATKPPACISLPIKHTRCLPKAVGPVCREGQQEKEGRRVCM